MQILPSQRFVVSPEELVIFDVRPSDEGFYFCGLENEFVQRNSTLGQFNVWSESYITTTVDRTVLCLDVRNTQARIIKGNEKDKLPSEIEPRSNDQQTSHQTLSHDHQTKCLSPHSLF